jgi:hypothetical protein
MSTTWVRRMLLSAIISMVLLVIGATAALACPLHGNPTCYPGRFTYNLTGSTCVNP